METACGTLYLNQQQEATLGKSWPDLCRNIQKSVIHIISVEVGAFTVTARAQVGPKGLQNVLIE